MEDALLSEKNYLYAMQKYVKEAENLIQRLSELAALQNTYQREYAENPDMVHAL